MIDKNDFLMGVKCAKGIALAFLPFGFALGLIAKTYNISGMVAILMSCLIYSGASQTLLTKIFSSSNFDILSTLLAAAMLNFRYVLINIPMYKKFKDSNIGLNMLTGLFYTDETVAYISLRKESSISFALGLNLTGYLSFCLSTLIGVLLGEIFPGYIVNSMKFVLYGAFFSLMISAIMINKKYISIIIITIVLKLILMLPFFAFMPKSLQIVAVLFLSSLIYAHMSTRGDKI